MVLSSIQPYLWTRLAILLLFGKVLVKMETFLVSFLQWLLSRTTLYVSRDDTHGSMHVTNNCLDSFVFDKGTDCKLSRYCHPLDRWYGNHHC